MIWDVAGQKTLGNIKQAYYRGSEGAMIVCDITRRELYFQLLTGLRLDVTGEIPVVLLQTNVI